MRWFDRLARRGEIAFVRRTGERLSQVTLTAYLAASRSDRTAIAIAVSKSVGHAVVRNRIRRRIAGALDALGPDVGAGPRRIFFVVRPEAATAAYATLAADVERVAARSLSAPRPGRPFRAPRSPGSP